MFEFKLDNKNKTISVKALLNGESSPIEVKVEKFEIVSENENSSFLKISEASSNRPWLDALLRKYKNKIAGINSIKIPADKAELLDEILG